MFQLIRLTFFKMASSLTLDLANHDGEPRSTITRSSARPHTDHSEGLAASHAEREVTAPAHVSKQPPSEDESC